MKRFEFFKESLKNIKTVGTVTRSSRYLCGSAVEAAQIGDSRVVVELGAGDGVMTRHILKAMRSDAVLFSFEINTKFNEQLSQITDRRLRVINLSAENLVNILKNNGYDQVDQVISALPFSVLPAELAENIVSQCHSLLKKGGRFVQIHYSLKARKIYQKVFGNVKTAFEPRNIPPAFVLTSTKRVD